MDRRTFNAALAGAAATSVLGCAAEPRSGAGGGIALYQSVGARLRHFEVDVELGGKFQWWAGIVRLPAA